MTPLLLALSCAWHQLPGPPGANCRSIAVNPAHRTALLCCTWNGSQGGVYASLDAGANWSPVEGIARDHGYGMNVIRFCPSEPRVAVCGSKIVGSNGLYVSSNSGWTWTQTNFPTGYANDVFWFPGARDTFYVVSGTGLAKTTDRGQNWTQVFSRTYCWQGAFKPGSADTLFVAGLYGLYRSFDAGVTWDTSLFRKRSYDLCFDPSCPDTMYVAGHVYGVFKVWDNGDAWDSLGNGDHYNTTIVFDSARREIWTGGFAFSPVSGRVTVSTDLGNSWLEFGPDRLFDPVAHDVALAPSDTLLFAAGEYFGPQRFSRQDSTWHPVAFDIAEANIRAICTGPNTIYTAGSVMGVSRSTDRGLSWTTSLGTPVCGLFHNTEMWPPGLVCSPTEPDSVYACFQGHVPYIDSVFRSTDGGSTWAGFHVPGLEEYDRVNLLAIHPLASETLYLSSSAGVHKSVDAGQTWNLCDTLAAYCVAVDPHDPLTVYSGWIGRARRSTDAGSTWHDFSTGLPEWSETMNIEPDPDSAGVLFAAMCGGEARDPLSGIYVHREAAARWTRVSNGLPGTFVLRPRVAVDTAGDCLWCVLPNQGAQVYRSFDRGANWVAADTGLLAYGVYFVHASDRAYIGTRGDGIWYWSRPSGLHPAPRDVAAGPAPTLFFSHSLELPAGPHRLLDRSGRLVLDGTGPVDTRHLGPGVYFIASPDRTVKAVKTH